MKLNINEPDVVKLYVKDRWTLRRIAKAYSTDHHTIKRILVQYNVEVGTIKRILPPMPEEQRRKIGAKTKGRIPTNKGIPPTEICIRRNIKSRMKTSIDLDNYPNLGKLQMLIKITSKHYKYLGYNDEVRKAFLDKFYNDRAFNLIYDNWITSGKSKWWRPSIDHKTAKCNGGSFDLDNLQFLTWFENRAKAEMTVDEWEAFKKATNTTSSLFAERILG